MYRVSAHGLDFDDDNIPIIIMYRDVSNIAIVAQPGLGVSVFINKHSLMSSPSFDAFDTGIHWMRLVQQIDTSELTEYHENRVKIIRQIYPGVIRVTRVINSTLTLRFAYDIDPGSSHF